MELGGIPHWHKQFLIDDNDSLNMIEHIRAKYGKKRINAFSDVRRKLDPNGIFLNSTMEKILKPF